MTLTTGQVLQNRYRIVSSLGEGGMGAVYRAQDTRLNITVALKELVPQPGLDSHTLAQLRRQFEQEAQVLARLDHPHLVRVTDFFSWQGSEYLVMNFVAGESLADLIAREGALPETEVLSWAEQLLDALGYCHAQGIIHRDVKPQNVIITSSPTSGECRGGGRAVLVDFGLVKLWDPGDPRTKTAMRGMGTPEYAPPEQYDIQMGHTDPRSDIYGLGATLYHALTGQSPLTATMRIADPEQFALLRSIVPGVSKRTEAAVLKAVELARSQRWQSAAEMAQALRGSAVAPAWGAEKGAVPTGLSLKARGGTRKMEDADRIAAPSAQVAVAEVVTPTAEPAPARRKRVPVWGWALGGLAVLVVGGLAMMALVVWVVGGGSPTPPTAETATTITAPVGKEEIATPTVVAVAEATSTSTPSLPSSVLAGTPVPLPEFAISPDNAGRVAQLACWGKGTVNEVVYSPDGKLLAVASSLGIYLYDAATLEEVRFIETDAWVTSVAFSPDGAYLASGSNDSTVRLWRVSDGTLLRTLERHTLSVKSVAFSPDGAYLASGSWDGTARLWRVSDGTLLRALEGHTSCVESVIFSPDGAYLASGSDDQTVRLWLVSDGTLLHTLEGHTGSVESVAFSPDGAYLASGSRDGTARLWQVSDGTLLRALEGHISWVQSVAFSPDGAYLASGLGDDTVRLWRVSDGTFLRALEGHTSGVTSVAFSLDGAYLASGSDDSTVRLWRVSDGSLLRALEGHTGGMESVVFSPAPLEGGTSGATLASGAWDNTARLWRVSDGTLLRALEGHISWVQSVAFSPDGAYLASGSGDDTVRLWRVSDGCLLRALEGHMSGVKSVAFSPDGATLVSGSWDGTARLWRVSDGSLLRTLEHEGGVSSVAFSPDGTILASGSGDGTVRLWGVSP